LPADGRLLQAVLVMQTRMEVQNRVRLVRTHARSEETEMGSISKLINMLGSLEASPA
jgi:hypothetical protein